MLIAIIYYKFFSKSPLTLNHNSTLNQMYQKSLSALITSPILKTYELNCFLYEFVAIGISTRSDGLKRRVIDPIVKINWAHTLLIKDNSWTRAYWRKKSISPAPRALAGRPSSTPREFSTPKANIPPTSPATGGCRDTKTNRFYYETKSGTNLRCVGYLRGSLRMPSRLQRPDGREIATDTPPLISERADIILIPEPPSVLLHPSPFLRRLRAPVEVPFRERGYPLFDPLLRLYA